MTIDVSGHPWSEEALFCKAQLYVQRMETHTTDDGQFGFWSALAVELLARAALAHISPVLLAADNNWRNLSYALGRERTQTKFTPRSISARDVLLRSKELIDNFDDEMVGFCSQHLERRNTELHSGYLAFDKVNTSEWLPRFYMACDALLNSMNKQLEDLFSNGDQARGLIEEFKNEAASTVTEDIEAHRLVWSRKSKKERDEAIERAGNWASRHVGHRVQCPSCNSQAILHGAANGTVVMGVKKDEIVLQQAMLPSSFECTACGLRISGLSKLSAAGLGEAFKATHSYSAAEYFELYTEEEMEEARLQMPEYEPDFND